MGLIDNMQQLREDEYEGLLKSPEVEETRRGTRAGGSAARTRSNTRRAKTTRSTQCAAIWPRWAPCLC